MREIVGLLRTNRNYRYSWSGQIVSEIGDHFNTIAVFSLALKGTGSGAVVAGVMLSRAIPVVLAGPLAGVLLDRMNRKHLMIASDLVRMVFALCFILAVQRPEPWLLYLLSALLMFASPFFTSGRSSILPSIVNRDELHTANSLTQTTQWTTTAVGAFLAGLSVHKFGYTWAFIINSLSFLFSAWCISRLSVKGRAFRPERKALTESDVVRPFHEYREGLRYMKSTPLILAVALVAVGWATGGGAAQILFGLFGEVVFKKGAEGIGVIWGCAGLGLIAGGAFAHAFGKRINFENYKKTISICYIIHGGAYVIFSQMEQYWAALIFIALSRSAVAVSSVLNFSHLLRHVSDTYRGRVFATLETMTWGTMMISMTIAGYASQHYSPRTIGACAGILSSMTAIFWTWANVTGRLPEPARVGVEADEVEVHGDQRWR
ncbi:MAG: MFS transporter [Bryobacteraceae bacterium]